MSMKADIPETHVLAVASHVVHGYVGNTMAAFAMRAMGCEVSALNTVQFSNHVAYGQFRGRSMSADEIHNLYRGLQENDLVDFDVMLSGFASSAAAVEAVGCIGRDLKLRSSIKPGSFFWVLDPVMGDEGEWYVDEDVLPIYKTLLPDADLLVPNLFELEILSDTKVRSPRDLVTAVTKLHTFQRIPHIAITSVRFTKSSPTISVIGSSRRSDGTPRLFEIIVPSLDCFFSGTGDLFAALTIARLRETTVAANLQATSSWLSPDGVSAVDLPLAKALEKVLASMHTMLGKSKAAVDRVMEEAGPEHLRQEAESKKKVDLLVTRAAEVKLVRNLKDLWEPKVVFKAIPLVLE